MRERCIMILTPTQKYIEMTDIAPHRQVKRDHHAIISAADHVDVIRWGKGFTALACFSAEAPYWMHTQRGDVKSWANLARLMDWLEDNGADDIRFITGDRGV